ncbi:MAG: hypothetical protein GZ088_09570 [Acidipila sp.]|nr:hypothetical protein [Acidipila sp.]
MALLQIFIHRELTPEQGQAYLQRMVDQIDQQAAQHQPGTNAVKVAEISRWENPFPEKLQPVFEQQGLKYDSVNLCYFNRFPGEHEAEVWRRWFEQSMRPWIVESFPAFDASKVHVRVMSDHESVQGAESF